MKKKVKETKRDKAIKKDWNKDKERQKTRKDK